MTPRSWDDLTAMAQVVIAHPPPIAHSLPVEFQALTGREVEVLQLLSEGRSNRNMAETLSLSERTIENHVLHILAKLDLESRTAAATYAMRHGLAG